MKGIYIDGVPGPGSYCSKINTIAGGGSVNGVRVKTTGIQNGSKTATLNE